MPTYRPNRWTRRSKLKESRSGASASSMSGGYPCFTAPLRDVAPYAKESGLAKGKLDELARVGRPNEQQKLVLALMKVGHLLVWRSPDKLLGQCAPKTVGGGIVLSRLKRGLTPHHRMGPVWPRPDEIGNGDVILRTMQAHRGTQSDSD